MPVKPTDSVWTWNGYRICKRMRKHVEKDQSGVGRVWPFEDLVFDTEMEAVQAAFDALSKQRDAAQQAADNAQKSVRKMWLRQQKLRKESSCPK